MARAGGVARLLTIEAELNRLAGLEAAQTGKFKSLSFAHQPLDAPRQFVQVSGGFRFAHAFLCGESGG